MDFLPAELLIALISTLKICICERFGFPASIAVFLFPERSGCFMEEITCRFLSVITILSIIFWRSSVADPVPNQLATLEENVDVVDFDVTISGNISSYEDGLRRYKYELINAVSLIV